MNNGAGASLSPTTGASAHFDLIDPLRAFAAISVLVYHVIETTSWQAPDGLIMAWFRFGWIGTDIFFVISGFVISLSALNTIAKNNGDRRSVLRQFADRRIRRIVPLHYLTLAFFLLVSRDVAVQPDFWANLLSHLFFIHNFFPAWHSAINPPNWTLGVEMQFYLLIILIIQFINERNLKYFIFGAFAIAFVWRGFAFFTATGESAHAIYRRFQVATQLAGMLDFFALGMLITFFTKTDIFRACQRNIYCKFILFCIFALWFVLTMRNITSLAGIYWLSPWTMMFPRSMTAILAALLVLLLCLFEPGPKTKKLLAPLIYLGVISYGIYLFHWPVLLIIKKLELPANAILPVALCASIGLASLSWHFYEKRFMKRKR